MRLKQFFLAYTWQVDEYWKWNLCVLGNQYLVVIWETPYINVNHLNNWCSKYSDQMHFCMHLCKIDVMVVEDYHVLGIIDDDFNMTVWIFQFQSQDLTMVTCIMSISQQSTLNITQSTNSPNLMFSKCDNWCFWLASPFSTIDVLFSIEI